MSFSDYLNGPKFRQTAERNQQEIDRLSTELAQLKKSMSELGALEALDVKRLLANDQAQLEEVKKAISTAQDELSRHLKRLSELRQRVPIAEELSTLHEKIEAIKSKLPLAETLEELQHQRDALRAEIIVLEENVLLETFAHYIPKFDFATSAHYMDRLDAVRSDQKSMIKSGTAVTGSDTWTVNNSKVEGRKLVNDMIKLVLRSFNNECDYCVDNVKFNNIESHEKRIEKSFETLNKLGRIMDVKVSHVYKQLKLDELHLSHEYQIKKQEEKEEAKRIREEQREQQKLEQEIRIAREKIAKERKHFQAAITDLQRRLEQASDECDRQILQTKLAEIQAGRDALDEEERIVDYREKNAKAGYVYIISNIGAFGEGIFKIGMTRRLEPMERIDELGDASVPFNFDVHALVFSDNAPELESKLHARFNSTRLNKINNRKEFFRANIVDIESTIKENFDATVDIKHIPIAEQYRESLKIND